MNDPKTGENMTIISFEKGAVQVLRNHFRRGLITIFKGGSSLSITVLKFLRKETKWRLFHLALQRGNAAILSNRIPGEQADLDGEM